jgi:acetolactate synthase-1/2/3 large subunit
VEGAGDQLGETEIDSAERLPELIARAFHVATAGRPGPVVIALP